MSGRTIVCPNCKTQNCCANDGNAPLLCGVCGCDMSTMEDVKRRVGISKSPDAIGDARALLCALENTEAENARLRAMLPQPVDGLPTEPGWYWVHGGFWEMVHVEVACDVDGYYTDSKRLVVSTEMIEELSEYAGKWYGPLTPPEVE